MKITYTITRKTPAHIYFAVFVNGAKAGDMCLRIEEWTLWCEITQPNEIYGDELPN